MSIVIKPKRRKEIAPDQVHSIPVLCFVWVRDIMFVTYLGEEGFLVLGVLPPLEPPQLSHVDHFVHEGLVGSTCMRCRRTGLAGAGRDSGAQRAM